MNWLLFHQSGIDFDSEIHHRLGGYLITETDDVPDCLPTTR